MSRLGLLLLLLLTGCASAPVREPAVQSQPSPSAQTADRPTQTHVSESRGAGVNRTIASSVEGRSIETTRVGWGTTRILLIGGIHGDETEGLAAVDEAIAALAARGSEVRALVVKDMNPDGTARRTRGNARGVDLNRNWPASNFTASRSRGSSPLSEPETQAVYETIETFSPEIVIVFHATYRGPFVNFDGPAETLASAFVRGANGVDERWRIVPDMGYATPGSLGTLIGVDRNTPILTIEFDRGQSAASASDAVREGFAELLSVLTRSRAASLRPR